MGSEKRLNEDLNNIKIILLDIEGTTTSISFVKETLFPYVRENLKSYLDENWGKDAFVSDLKLLKEQNDRDILEKVEDHVPIEEGDEEKNTLIKNIFWQMDCDRKNTALKQLQGHIWEEGYKSGVLKGHIYDDVAPCFRQWVHDGRRLFIYSSGSVEAQKLLYGNTTEGSLLDSLSGYFDTTIGAKTESKSYAAIAASVDCPADNILFLTDSVKEAEAARTAGMSAVLVVREGNAPLTSEDKESFSVITSFKDLEMERSCKRARPCAETESEAATEVNDTKEKEAVVEEKMEVEDTEKVDETKPKEQMEETPADVPPTEMETELSTEKTENGDKPPEGEEVKETPQVEEIKSDDTVRETETEKETPIVTHPPEEAEEVKEKKVTEETKEEKCEPKEDKEEKMVEIVKIEEVEKADEDKSTSAPTDDASKEDCPVEEKADNPNGVTETEPEKEGEKSSETLGKTNETEKTEEKKETTEESADKAADEEKPVNGVPEEKVNGAEKVAEELAVNGTDDEIKTKSVTVEAADTVAAAE